MNPVIPNLLARHLLDPGRQDVGIAGVLAILSGSAAEKVSRRETGGRPEGVRPPGGSTECLAWGYCYTSYGFIMGDDGFEGRENPCFD